MGDGGYQARLTEARTVEDITDDGLVDLDSYAMDREGFTENITRLNPGQQICQFKASLVEGRIRKNGVFIVTLAIETADKAQALRIGDFPGMALDVIVNKFDYEAERG